MSSRLGPVVGHEAEADDGQASLAESRGAGDGGDGTLGGSHC